MHGLCAPRNTVDHAGSHARAHFSPPQTILRVTFYTRSFLLACSCTRDSPKINHIEIGSRAKQRCPSTYQKQTGNSPSGSVQEPRLNSSHLEGSKQLHTSLHQSSFPTTSKTCLLLLHTIYSGFPASPPATLHTPYSHLYRMEPCLPHIKTQLQEPEFPKSAPSSSLPQNTSQMVSSSTEGIMVVFFLKANGMDIHGQESLATILIARETDIQQWLLHV